MDGSQEQVLFHRAAALGVSLNLDSLNKTNDLISCFASLLSKCDKTLSWDPSTQTEIQNKQRIVKAMRQLHLSHLLPDVSTLNPRLRTRIVNAIDGLISAAERLQVPQKPGEVILSDSSSKENIPPANLSVKPASIARSSRDSFSSKGSNSLNSTPVNPFVARRTLRRTPVKADALPRSPQGPNEALMHTIPQTPLPAASSPATCPLVRLPGEKLLRTPVHAPTSHVAIPPMPTALTVTPAPLPLPLPSAQTPDAIPRTPGTTLLASRAHTPAAQISSTASTPATATITMDTQYLSQLYLQREAELLEKELGRAMRSLKAAQEQQELLGHQNKKIAENVNTLRKETEQVIEMLRSEGLWDGDEEYDLPEETAQITMRIPLLYSKQKAVEERLKQTQEAFLHTQALIVETERKRHERQERAAPEREARKQKPRRLEPQGAQVKVGDMALDSESAAEELPEEDDADYELQMQFLMARAELCVVRQEVLQRAREELCRLREIKQASRFEQWQPPMMLGWAPGSLATSTDKDLSEEGSWPGAQYHPRPGYCFRSVFPRSKKT